MLIHLMISWNLSFDPINFLNTKAHRRRQKQKKNLQYPKNRNSFCNEINFFSNLHSLKFNYEVLKEWKILWRVSHFPVFEKTVFLKQNKIKTNP